MSLSSSKSLHRRHGSLNFFVHISPPGVASQGSSARHLLPGVALARPPVAPRAQGRAVLQVPVQLEAEGGLHQSVPLRPGRVSGSPTRSRSEIFGPDTGPDDAVPANSGSLEFKFPFNLVD